MLSSGMFARHQPPAPALRRGRALYVDPRSFPEKSLLCFHTLAHSFIFRIQHFSLQALCFQSLPHSFQKRGGGYQLFPKWNSTLSTHPPPTYSSSFFSHSCTLFGAMGATQPFWNQFVPHSFYRNGGGGVLFPHPEGDADPEKRSAEGLLKFCLWDFVPRPFRLPLSAAAFGSLRVFA